MARQVFLATDEMRERVQSLAGRGVRQEDIAKIIGCDAKTLRKHFRNHLDRGMAEANAKVTGFLFDAAEEGSVTAQIFWLKTRAGWRESKEPEDATPGSDAEATAPVVIVPDNGRDPGLTEALRKAQEKYFGKKKPR
jgi:hypothetical protein